MGFPCASVPSDVSLIPAGVASNFSVWARTAFVPSFDFAGSSFQVPTQFSPAKAAVPTDNAAMPTNRERTNWFFCIHDLL